MSRHYNIADNVTIIHYVVMRIEIDRSRTKNLSLLLVLLVTMGCSSEPIANAQQSGDNRFDQLVRYLETPQYGPVVKIAGKTLFHLETSAIGLCKVERAKCTIPTNVDGSDQPCWLDFSDKVSKFLADRKISFGVGEGDYWIEGQGRIAVQPGHFGHLGEYTCQVEVTHIDLIEKGPPWMWGPPPPIEK